MAAPHFSDFPDRLPSIFEVLVALEESLPVKRSLSPKKRQRLIKEENVSYIRLLAEAYDLVGRLSEWVGGGAPGEPPTALRIDTARFLHRELDAYRVFLREVPVVGLPMEDAVEVWVRARLPRWAGFLRHASSLLRAPVGGSPNLVLSGLLHALVPLKDSPYQPIVELIGWWHSHVDPTAGEDDAPSSGVRALGPVRLFG